MKVFCSLVIAFYLFGAALAATACVKKDLAELMAQSLAMTPCLSRQFVNDAIACAKKRTITQCGDKIGQPIIPNEKDTIALTKCLHLNSADAVSNAVIVSSSMNDADKATAMAAFKQCITNAPSDPTVYMMCAGSGLMAGKCSNIPI